MIGKWSKGSRFYQIAVLFGAGAFVLSWIGKEPAFTAVATAALAGMGGQNIAERWKTTTYERGPEGE